MKSNLILTLLILASALLHVGPIVPVLLLAGGFVSITENNVAILLFVMMLNVLALVQLHLWNAKPLR
jgi:hypothetical protein